MKYTYFVSYFYGIGFGSIVITLNSKIKSLEDIKQVQDYIKDTFCDGKTAIILWFNELDKTDSQEKVDN